MATEYLTMQEIRRKEIIAHPNKDLKVRVGVFLIMGIVMFAMFGAYLCLHYTFYMPPFGCVDIFALGIGILLLILGINFMQEAYILVRMYNLELLRH